MVKGHNEEVVKSIIQLFDTVGCPALIIMHTPNAGEEVDNGYGVDFDLPPYAVIHKGNIYDDNVSKKIYEWQRGNVDLFKFNEEGCAPNIDALAEEMKMVDGYEIVWRRENV